MKTTLLLFACTLLIGKGVYTPVFAQENTAPAAAVLPITAHKAAGSAPFRAEG